MHGHIVESPNRHPSIVDPDAAIRMGGAEAANSTGIAIAYSQEEGMLWRVEGEEHFRQRLGIGMSLMFGEFVVTWRFVCWPRVAAILRRTSAAPAFPVVSLIRQVGYRKERCARGGKYCQDGEHRPYFFERYCHFVCCWRMRMWRSSQSILSLLE